MKLIDGKSFRETSVNEVVDYLRSRDEKDLLVYTRDVSVVNDSNQMMIHIKKKNNTFVYPIRRSFLYKLLKWRGIQSHTVGHFSSNTLTAICNDNLRDISSSSYNTSVVVKIVNNEAVSIVSTNFTNISDLEVIEQVSRQKKIAHISRDDFCMRIYTDILSTAEINVDDVCGFSLNIANSEIGFCTLKVEHFIYRYICSNGSIIGLTKNYINEVHYKKEKTNIMKHLEMALQDVPSEPIGFIEGAMKSINIEAKYSFPDIQYKVNSIIGTKDGYGFFSEFDEQSKSKYGLFNHITHTAKKFGVLKRYKLEQLAGNLILK